MEKVEKFFKKPWPYWVGGLLLGIMNILLLVVTGKSWGISTGFLYWGGGLLETLQIDISHWTYFSHFDYGLSEGQSFWHNRYTVLIIATILGAGISALAASELRIKPIKNRRQLFFGLLGGILMGYGSRLSFGCNVGAYFSAIPSMSLHGWVVAIFMFLGAWVGAKILVKYIL